VNAPAIPPLLRMANAAVRERAKALIDALPEGWLVRFSPPTRTLDQNALLHAVLAEAEAKGFATDDGRRLDLEDAKTAFVSGWQVEQGHPSDIVLFNGRPIQLRRSTTTFSRAELSSLIEFIRAECAHRGIYLSEGRP